MAKATALSNRGVQAWADRYTAQANAYKKASTSKAPSKTGKNATPGYNPLGAQYKYYKPPTKKTYSTFLPMVTKPTVGGLTEAQKQAIYEKYFSGRGLTPTTAQPMAVPVTEPAASSGPSWSYGGNNAYDYYNQSSGGGGGDTETAPDITWSEFDSGVGAKPDWWKAMKPSAVNDATEFLASLNMMIPFLSPEDQKAVASNIYTQDAKNFGHLNPEKIQFLVSDPNLPTQTRRLFTDALRAQQAMAALTSLAGAVGKKDEELGLGYRYLRSILNLGNQFGGNSAQGSGQTRQQYINMMSALDPLVAQAKTPQLAPYESLVKMLTTPFFTNGSLVPLSKDANGRVIFGTPNKGLL